MRTCSSVANLDRLYDELDLLDDYDYEGEVSNKSARSSHRHSFSGGVSPYRKQINSESFHQDIQGDFLLIAHVAHTFSHGKRESILKIYG